MRATHKGSIQWDDVHQVTEAQACLQQRPRYLDSWGLELRIEKEFHRIITRLAVNVHRSSIVWCQRIVEPIVVGKPGTWLGNRYQLPRSRMIEMGLSLAFIVQYLCNACGRLQQRTHFVYTCRIIDVDMGHLMIGHSKGNARPGIQQFSAQLLPHGNHSMLPQFPIEVNRPGDRDDTVLGHNHNPGVTRPVVVDEMPTERIEFSQILGNGILHGAEALETVVQVGQVDQGECRIIAPIHSLSSLCYPRARTNRGIGTPEAEEREWAQLFLE